MQFYDILSAIGVALSLLAFFMNLFLGLPSESKIYTILNIIGSALSCYASFQMGFMPFVVLEGTWFTASVIGFCKPYYLKWNPKKGIFTTSA